MRMNSTSYSDTVSTRTTASCSSIDSVSIPTRDPGLTSTSNKYFTSQAPSFLRVHTTRPPLPRHRHTAAQTQIRPRHMGIPRSSGDIVIAASFLAPRPTATLQPIASALASVAAALRFPTATALATCTAVLIPDLRPTTRAVFSAYQLVAIFPVSHSAAVF